MADGILTAAAAVTQALFLVGGVYVYLALARQISAQRPAELELPEKTFGLVDLIVASGLMALYLWNALLSSKHSGKQDLSVNDLIVNVLFSAAVLIIVAAVVHFRGIDVSRLAGWAKLGFARTLMTGTILLFAAYPLIIVADTLTQRLLGTPSSKQNIIELFTDSQTLQQRVLIIVLAVAVAPVVEEFIFRFLVYGVVKRYLGRFVGLLVNAALFAAVHAHLPSAGPLFVLAVCFTLAYEWSGSLLVCMTMHALFNGITLTALAFPDILRQ
ncbi:MAG: type II CAAX endopeptidase family protein [Chthoniobacterales bacterium]